MLKKAFTGAFLLLLTLIAAVSFFLRKGYSLPPTVVVLFIFLIVAYAAIRFKVYWLRYILLLASISYFGFYEGSCLCPTGAFQNIFLYLALHKTAKIWLYLMEVALLFTFVFFLGNLYCGWVCHKGGIQEFLYRPKFAVKVPPKLDALLINFRYMVLAVTLAYPFLKHQKFFHKVDPFRALFNLEGSTALLIFLAFTLLVSVFIYRPFCKYFCPLGAALGIINRLGLFKISFRKDQPCINCTVCERNCALNAIKACRLPEPRVDMRICIACMECIRTCPKKTLHLELDVLPSPSKV